MAIKNKEAMGQVIPHSLFYENLSNFDPCRSAPCFRRSMLCKNYMCQKERKGKDNSKKHSTPHQIS